VADKLRSWKASSEVQETFEGEREKGEKEMQMKIHRIYRSSTIALIAVLIVFAPRLYKAAQGTCRTVRLLTSDFSDAFGPYTPQQYLSIKTADVDGDGKDDICYPEVRTSFGFVVMRGGILCRTSSSGFAVSRWTSQFTSSSWTSNESYWRTVRYPDLNGDGKADICGRSSTGIICALSTGSSFRMPGSPIFSDGTTLWSNFFSDATGWGNDPSYWKTIQYPDLNSDGKADVCGRYFDGIYCALSNGTTFDAATRWDQTFSNSNNWNSNPGYWSTIQFADVTGDGKPDVCGRAWSGVKCASNTGSAFLNTTFTGTLWTQQYSDLLGWNTEKYYSTLQFGDVNGDGKADICGRGSGGIYCGRSTGSSFADTSTLHLTDFSDAAGWDQERFYKSIRLIDANADNKADICGRGFAGILCASSGWNAQGFPVSGIDRQTGRLFPDSTISFAPVRLRVPNFGDVDGFGASESYWGTVQPHKQRVWTTFDPGSLPSFPSVLVEWIGRGYAGIYISEFDSAECTFNP